MNSNDKDKEKDKRRAEQMLEAEKNEARDGAEGKTKGQKSGEKSVSSHSEGKSLAAGAAGKADSVQSAQKSEKRGQQGKDGKKGGKNQSGPHAVQSSNNGGSNSSNRRSEKDKTSSKQQQTLQDGGSRPTKGAPSGSSRIQNSAEKESNQEQLIMKQQIVGDLAKDLKAKQEGKSSSPLSNAEPSPVKLLLQTPGKKDDEATQRNMPLISSQQATSNSMARGKVQGLGGPINPEERDGSSASGLQAKASAGAASSTEKSMNKRDKKFMRKVQQQPVSTILKEPSQGKSHNSVIEDEAEKIGPGGAASHHQGVQAQSLPQSQGTHQQDSPEKATNSEMDQAWSKQQAAQSNSTIKVPPKAETANDADKNTEMQIMDDQAAENMAKDNIDEESFQAPVPLSIEDKVRQSIPKMKPTIAEKFDQVDGACEYFFILERENEKVQDQIQQIQTQKKITEKEQLLHPAPQNTKTCQELQAKIEELQKTLHEMPKGYPQKYMYKYPKVDAMTCQTQVDNDEYKGSIDKYLVDHPDRSRGIQAAAQQLRVYSNQRIAIRKGIEYEQDKVDEKPEQMTKYMPQMRKRRGKRSRSEEIETLKFEHGDDTSSSDESEFEKQIPNLTTAKKDTFKYESYNQRKVQRRDELLAPCGLKPEPKMLFLSDKNGSKYTAEQLDEYLKFCDTIMRDTPIQGGYCGIWLRGSSMYQENAMKLLHLYDYNFDLAKFHALYPMVMNDPVKRREMQEIARNYPLELAKEVANAIIDLQGCKAEEINEILQNFRNDLGNRITEDRLKYHLAILAKIKIATPPDIEQKIAESLEFSRQLRKRWPGSTRTATNIPQDKKLKLSELIELYEQQKSYCYITQEMIVLEQQLAKARHWAELVESIREQEVQLRTIEQIYQDGKNIPVNFQELMNEVKARKTQAEQLDQRIRAEMALRRTRREANVGTSRKSGKRSASNAAGQEDVANEDSQEGAVAGQPDKEQIFRDLLAEARKAKLLSDSSQKLQAKVNEIDKWKAEVKGLFQNHEEEVANFKRYREHYRGLLARSQGFHIELSLMKNLQKKCHLIDWRDRVDDTWKKVDSGVRMTLEQLEHVLEDGRERLFLVKDAKGVYAISQYVRDYQPQFRWQEDQTGDDTQAQEQTDKLRILMPLIQNFQSLDLLIAIHYEASQFDKVIRVMLKKFRGGQGESSSSAEDASMSNGGAQAAPEAAGAAGASSDAQAAGQRGPGAGTAEAALGISTLLENVDSKNRIQFSYLEELESKGLKMRVEIDKFREFRTKLKEIRDVAQHCQALMQKSGTDGQVSDGVFRITSESGLRDVIQARKSFLSLNVISQDFLLFQQNFQPYIFWINKSVETIKTYCRALGLKQNQLNLFDTIQDSEASDSESELEAPAGDQKDQSALRSRAAGKQKNYNPFDLEMDYHSLKALCAELVPPGSVTAEQDAEMDSSAPVEAEARRGKGSGAICGLGKFLFFRETNHGKYLLQILSKTNALIGEFHMMKEQKRTENFDLNAYFKLLDNFYSCGLPVEQSVIEEAKAELKREKWIKKYNDIQMVGNQKLQASSQLQNSQGQAYDLSQSASGKHQRSIRMMPQTNAPSAKEGSLMQERSPSPKSPGSSQSKAVAVVRPQTSKQQAVLGQSGNTASAPPQSSPSTGHIRIKNLEVLIKEFQTSPEINQDKTCQKMAERLQEQQRSCQNWLEKFQKIFNSVGQFDPKGGLQQVRQLLEDGGHLELKLKELHELQIHQRELNEWKRVTARIFDQTHNAGEPVTLEQLEKHIKDTIDITEGANSKYIQLLQALKDLATIWKIKARTLLKIRPNESMHSHQGTSYQQRQALARGEELENAAMLGTSMSDSQIQQYEAPIDGKYENAEQSQPGLSGGEGAPQQQSQQEGEWAGDANGESCLHRETAVMANQEEDEKEQDLFCICRQPENGSLMLCCDFCDMWYHYTCIGLPQDLKLLEKVKYKCIGCAIREGRFTYALSSSAGAGTDTSNASLDPQGHVGLYSPVMPNRLQVLRELEQDKPVGPKLFLNMSRASGDSSAQLMQPSQLPEASQEQQACQQEIEKLLLEHFFSKGRVQLEQFQQVLREGRDGIPLLLEELEDLTLIDTRIEAWRERANKAIKAGPMAQSLWLNFQKINSAADAKESDVIAMQESERVKDQELVDLLVESESFPVLLYEAKKLVQILHFRDWLRECFQLLYQFNSSLAKVNKIKLRKHIKRLALKAEVIIGLAPELIKYKMKAGKSDSKNSLALQEGSISSQQDSLSQYHETLAELKASSEVEVNTVYMSWLLSNLSASGAGAKAEVADKLGQEHPGLNWRVDWRKDLKPQVKFWDTSMTRTSDGGDLVDQGNDAAEDIVTHPERPSPMPSSPQMVDASRQKDIALDSSQIERGPGGPPAMKQRIGMGIIEINMEEEVMNELRPSSLADEAQPFPGERNGQTSTMQPPAEPSSLLIGLPPIEREDAVLGQPQALPAALLAPGTADVAQEGSMRPTTVAPSQLPGSVGPSPVEGEGHNIHENAKGVVVQGQHDMLHIFHSQHYGQAAVGQEHEQAQACGSGLRPTTLLPSLQMTLQDQNIGQQHPQGMPVPIQQRMLLNQAPTTMPNEPMGPLQSLPSIRAIAGDRNRDGENVFMSPAQHPSMMQQQPATNAQALGGLPIGRGMPDTTDIGHQPGGLINPAVVDEGPQAQDLTMQSPSQAPLVNLPASHMEQPQQQSQMLQALPTSARLSELADLVVKIIANEKVIEQNLQPSGPREDLSGLQRQSAPETEAEGMVGAGGDIQDADALGGGRVVNVWIQQAREHLELAGQGQGPHASLMQAEDLNAKTEQFFKEAEELLKLLD